VQAFVMRDAECQWLSDVQHAQMFGYLPVTIASIADAGRCEHLRQVEHLRVHQVSIAACDEQLYGPAPHASNTLRNCLHMFGFVV
jgi:hypothetical protein